MNPAVARIILSKRPALLLAPPTATFVEAGTLTGSGSTYTKTGASFGAAFANRRVIVLCGASAPNSRVFSSSTLGGLTAALAAEAHTAGSSLAMIVSAVVPTGTTGDISITMSNTVFSDIAYAVYTLDDSLLNSTTPVTSTGNTAGATSMASGAFAASAGGVILSAAGFTNGSSKTPASVTDDKSDTITIGNSSGDLIAAAANGIVGGNTTLTTTWTGTFDGALAVASWR